jgi:hypothetical protein
MVFAVAMHNLVIVIDVHVDQDKIDALVSCLEEEIHTVFKVEVVTFLGIHDNETELLVEILEDFLVAGVLR